MSRKRNPDASGNAWWTERTRELTAIALCGFCLYALLCLGTLDHTSVGDGSIAVGNGSNLGGKFGYYLGLGFAWLFGYAAFLPFLFAIGFAVVLFWRREVERLVLKVLGAVIFTAMIALLLAGPDGGSGVSSMAPFGAGGKFGANLSPLLARTFGGFGRLLLLSFGALISLLLVTEWMFSTILMRLTSLLEGLWTRLRPARKPEPRRASRAAAAAEPAVAARKAASAEQVDAALKEQAEEEQRVDPDEGEVLAVRKGRRRGKAAADEDAEQEAEQSEDDEVAPRTTGRKFTPVAQDEEDDEEEEEESEEDEEDAKAPVVSIPVVVPRVTVQKPKPRPRPKPVQSDLPWDATYPFPPVESFREPQVADSGATQALLQKNSEAIVAKLASFGIGAEMVGVAVGPTVTQYELRLAEGVRVNKVAGFDADLASALRAVTVRVVAPIPGRDTIGIEVPNEKRNMVFMRELLEQYGRAEEHAIPLFLGKAGEGSPIVVDLAKMPHLLIAGTTGSGKSVCINTILLSILVTRTPAQVRLILVDPKMVELQAYKNVPHLCCDVVTNMKKAPGVLEWAVNEMENRYALFSAAGVNHIKLYNRLDKAELEKRFGRPPEPDRVQLPYIVIIIDELADLMSTARNEVEDSIQRLAQKSRAVGMHVILATQRPSVDVITGVIKANLPCQIAFKVNRKLDSRVILDTNGAEKLVGNGDMLYVPPGGAAIMRAQGTYVGDDEIAAVVKFLEEKGQRPTFLPDLVQTQGSSRSSAADKDDLYREAVEVILGQQRGSATLLQRALSVGYTRATRLLELMEEDGLVGPFVGSKSREVLLTIEEWKAREAAIAEELAAQEEAGFVEGEEVAETDDALEPEEDAEVAAAGAEPAEDGEPEKGS
ncbi:MAG: hypothetical protein RL148_1206 [Planctomycetota bacterium]